MDDTFGMLVDDLRLARMNTDVCKDAVGEIQSAIDALIEERFGDALVTAKEIAAKAKQREDEAYAALKNHAISRYQAGGVEKTNGPVTVTTSVKLVYDDKSALPWCIANPTLHQYLAVDRKKLDKALAAMGEKPEFVDERVEYGVRIASQL